MDAATRRSLAAIVPMIMGALNPPSVVDVVRCCDVARRFPRRRRDGRVGRRRWINRSFDLALSLEVAEHLQPCRTESFVADLVRLAAAVCFSAAIPLQGGVDHVNERWQDEWAAVFANHGYRAVDLIRAKVWDNPEVRPWYAQNMFLYVAPGVAPEGDQLPLRLVHPARYLFRLSGTLDAVEHPPPLGVRQLVRETGRTARALVKRGREAMVR